MNYDHLRIEEKTSTLAVQNGNITSLKTLNIQKHGIRRFDGGKIFQSARTGEANLDLLLKETFELAGGGIPHEYGFAPAQTMSNTGDRIDRSTFDAFRTGVESLRVQFPDFTFSGSCSLKTKSVALKSDYGLDLSSVGDFCVWYLIYQRKGSGNMMDGYIESASSRPDILRDISEQARFIRATQKEANLQSGRMPVLLVDTLQPLSKLSESILINRYKEGSALYSGKMGQKLFSEDISIFDAGYDPVEEPLQFFDGDGVVRENELMLINHGQFTGLLCDLRFGHKFSVSSTGNGLRAFDRGTLLGPKSLRYKPGRNSWQSILKDLDRCLVAVVAAGGDSNDLGEFSSPVQAGYIFERGELIGRSPQVTVKAPLDRLLGNDLIAVSADGFTSATKKPCLISEMEVFLN